jgi:hypothetical protein
MDVGFKKVNLSAGVARSNIRRVAMRQDNAGESGQDQAWPGAVRWDFGEIGVHVHETLWQCDATRAGRLYQRSLFGTREEAEAFVEKMREVEPDQMFNVEAIKASTVWN